MAMTDRDKKALMILGGIAGLAVVFFVVTQVLGGGGEETSAPAPPAPSAPASESPSPSPEVAAPSDPTFTGRDPFVPPVGLATDTSSTTADTSTDTTSTTDTSTDPTTPVEPTPGTGGGNQNGGGGGNKGPGNHKTVHGQDVKLQDIYRTGGAKKAQIEVDGNVYTVKAGDRFNGSFKLVSIDGRCTRIIFGDQAFKLCLKKA